MANPYRDELGRFCSADEMNDAVQYLVSAGHMNKAMEPLHGLKQIEAKENKAGFFPKRPCKCGSNA